MKQITLTALQERAVPNNLRKEYWGRRQTQKWRGVGKEVRGEAGRAGSAGERGWSSGGRKTQRTSLLGLPLQDFYIQEHMMFSFKWLVIHGCWSPLKTLPHTTLEYQRKGPSTSCVACMDKGKRWDMPGEWIKNSGEESGAKVSVETEPCMHILRGQGERRRISLHVGWLLKLFFHLSTSSHPQVELGQATTWCQKNPWPLLIELDKI